MSPRRSVPEESALPEDDLIPGMSPLPRESWLSPIKRLLFIVTMLPVGIIFDWAIMERPGQGLRWALRENRRWAALMSGRRPLPASMVRSGWTHTGPANFRNHQGLDMTVRHEGRDFTVNWGRERGGGIFILQDGGLTHFYPEYGTLPRPLNADSALARLAELVELHDQEASRKKEERRAAIAANPPAIAGVIRGKLIELE